jgi:uncharacterized membrane protein YphA (DoxX/SURF4 family)
MHTAIWVLQVLLAATFAAAGLLKLTRPIDALARTIGAWVRDVPAPLIRVIGGLEVAGAVGLIVPSALGILPWLTALSAAGLVIVMMGALVVHLRRREPQSIAVNVVLALLAAAIVWGQTDPYLSTSHLPDCNAQPQPTPHNGSADSVRQITSAVLSRRRDSEPKKASGSSIVLPTFSAPARRAWATCVRSGY